MKKLSALFLVLLFSATLGSAKTDDQITDLNAAIKQATTENKALFIIYGRATCGNCNALHGYIDQHQLRLTKTSFLIANIDCDDPAQSSNFKGKYRNNLDGNTLPFVVIAKPDGTLVKARTGYGTADQFNDFIRDAKKDLKKE
ncbi:hypothetical protein DB345_01815 [Spartobacteria bacterium LR76]|nr:hypothetical protein DB345_01815 [Spartobacteria bacterium LR76]